MCHAPEVGGGGKVGDAHSEIFQVALNLCLVEKSQVGMGLHVSKNKENWATKSLCSQ